MNISLHIQASSIQNNSPCNNITTINDYNEIIKDNNNDKITSTNQKLSENNINLENDMKLQILKSK